MGIRSVTDIDAWNAYPQHRQWFNKMFIADMFGYTHGPGGVPVPHLDYYIVRPVINLYGMGAGASIQHLSPTEPNTVAPGSFWCELLHGEQVSWELKWTNNRWATTSAWAAETSDQLWLFHTWRKIDREINVPSQLDVLQGCESINIETIGDKIFEVHLRSTPDPTGWKEMVPAWHHNVEKLTATLSSTHTFVESSDYVYGTDHVRLGFFCK